jgi:hypothetical protein
MLKIKSQPYNSVWISADSQEELGRTFIRFQEHYESPNPDFRGKIFTLGMVRQWYSVKYGADTYHHDWTGFNFPSRVLLPFKQGLFDPLTSEEIELLNLFKYRHDNFYIMGAQNNATLRHELSHALYDSNEKYRNEIDSYIKKNKRGLAKTRKYILDKGYAEEVINDELQAYITDNDDQTIISNTDPHIILDINKIYKKYRKLQ